MLLFVCNETVESKLVKLETRHTVILPPTASILWVNLLSVVPSLELTLPFSVDMPYF